MQIRSARFIKGIVKEDIYLEDDKPQVAFIGRSNVGKSSTINTLTGQKGLAKTSDFPGKTTEINLFLINNTHYLLDLPGYGYAKASWEVRNKLLKLIEWYLFESPYKQKKVVLIIDAKVGPTEYDLGMLKSLEEAGKDVVIIANKIDKLKKMAYEKQMAEIQAAIGNHKIIPFSAEERKGLREAVTEIFG